MSADFRQQQEQDEQRTLELLGALNRVTLGLAGESDARFLAQALGLEGFNYRRGGEDE